jgi:hypothetical protein
MVSGVGTAGYRDIPHRDMPWVLALPSVRIYGIHIKGMDMHHATDALYRVGYFGTRISIYVYCVSSWDKSIVLLVARA